MQLSNFLNNNGSDKINVIAINWAEDELNDAALQRLEKFVRNLHPAIRVIYSNKKLLKHFSPLTSVPINFVYNKDGKLIFGDGKQGYLSSHDLINILNQTR